MSKIFQRRNPKTKKYIKFRRGRKRTKIIGSSKKPYSGVPRS